MTLEQITQRILAAAEAQDLDALREALQQRQSAMTILPSMTPMPELRDAVAASIGAGDEARRAIRTIQQRLRKETRRLTNIEHGFLRVLVPAKHRIDCKG